MHVMWIVITIRLHVCVYVIMLCDFVHFPLQNWNAYIGRLGRKDFRFDVSGNSISERASLYDSVSEDGSFLGNSGAGSYTVGVMIDFLVNKSLVEPSSTRNSVDEELVLFGSFHGSDFSTQIKGE